MFVEMMREVKKYGLEFEIGGRRTTTVRTLAQLDEIFRCVVERLFRDS